MLKIEVDRGKNMLNWPLMMNILELAAVETTAFYWLRWKTTSFILWISGIFNPFQAFQTFQLFNLFQNYHVFSKDRIETCSQYWNAYIKDIWHGLKSKFAPANFCLQIISSFLVVCQTIISSKYFLSESLQITHLKKVQNCFNFQHF